MDRPARWSLALPAVGVAAGMWLIAAGLTPAKGADAPTRAASSAELVAVSAGSASFKTGAARADAGVTEVAAFRIDETEVTVAAYRRCVEAGACTLFTTASAAHLRESNRFVESSSCNGGRSDRDAHPMNCVDWYQAQAYCGWLGQRLPTALEWRLAALGSDGREFPWGNDKPDRSHANFCASGDCSGGEGAATAPVGNTPKGASPSGLHDTAGNVWEWTATQRAQRGLDAGDTRLRCGSSFDNGKHSLMSCWSLGAHRRSPTGGFRCAK